jgi:hypothetical protein
MEGEEIPAQGRKSWEILSPRSGWRASVSLERLTYVPEGAKRTRETELNAQRFLNSIIPFPFPLRLSASA